MQINVTKTYLPPIAEYQRRLQDIWSRGWVTNHGPFVNELELKLKDYLGLDYLLFVSSGTTALQIALRALDLEGEVITTPFSYVATTSSIVWHGCEPVMVDISSDTLNIDPQKIEKAITERTSAIMATHVYGNACDIAAIQDIAERHGLAVIYDAAHAFGTKYRNRSAFEYGDVSATSFHATKLFHTVEGGAVIARTPELLKRLALMRNFGHTSPTDFECAGINGKNSELHAAMGLCNLNYVEENLRIRRELSVYYDQRLAGLPLRRPMVTPGCEYNFAYYPIIFDSETTLLHTVEALKLHNIYPRRYFYPSLSTLPYLKRRFETPISENIAPRVLCLPLYHSLSVEEIDMICRLISRSIRY
jgi:dTDP-4-amino-4,6-dideoxygalactose transaminase